MHSEEARKVLKKLTHLLLNPAKTPTQLKKEVLELSVLFEQLCIFDLNEEPQQHQRIADGLAINPKNAATCTVDHIRTIQYLRALYANIHDLRKVITNRPINILYPGSGPFGVLVLPIMSIVPPEVAKFTIIDINKTSIDSVKAITKALDLEESVHHFEVANAVAYQIPQHLKPDIVILETMLAALEDEPQVAISMNLIKQAPEAVLIPEEIRVDFAMGRPDIEFSTDIPTKAKAAHRIHIGHVFTINREMIATWQPTTKHLPAATLTIPDNVEAEHVPLLLTHIRLDKTHTIKESESGLTRPIGAMTIAGSIKAGSKIQFRYELGKYPGLKAL